MAQQMRFSYDLLFDRPLLVGLGTISVANASNHRLHRVHRASAVHHRYPGRPLCSSYTDHGEYVPDASDRLIHGPGYVFVPGHGILGEDCNMPTSTPYGQITIGL